MLLWLVKSDVNVEHSTFLLQDVLERICLDILAFVFSFLDFGQVNLQFDDRNRSCLYESICFKCKNAVECLVEHLHLLDQLLSIHLMESWRILIDEIMHQDVQVAGVDGQTSCHRSIHVDLDRLLVISVLSLLLFSVDLFDFISNQLKGNLSKLLCLEKLHFLILLQFDDLGVEHLVKLRHEAELLKLQRCQTILER